MAKSKEAAIAEQTKFLKAQILTAKKYAARRDILGALLEEDKAYSLNEVDDKIKTFMEGTVK